MKPSRRRFSLPFFFLFAGLVGFAAGAGAGCGPKQDLCPTGPNMECVEAVGGGVGGDMGDQGGGGGGNTCMTSLMVCGGMPTCPVTCNGKLQCPPCM